MSKQTVNIGTSPNDGTGDQLRTAFDKLNSNNDEIYLAGPVGTNVQILSNSISTTNIDGDLTITPNGNGSINLSSAVDFASSASITGTLDVLGDTTISTVTSTGLATLASANITGNATVGNDLGVISDLTIGGLATLSNTTFNATSTIDVGANKITNVANPTDPQDVATKDYADGLSSGIYVGWSITDGVTTETINSTDTLTVYGTTNEVEVAVSATDTLTLGLPDNVTLTTSITAPTITSSTLIDAAILTASTSIDTVALTATGLTTLGDTTFSATSAIDAGANAITNMADPTNAQDGATKAYVDGLSGGGYAGWSITDGVTTEAIDSGNTLTVNGTANEVDVAVSSTDTLTVGLPAAVSVTTSITAPTVTTDDLTIPSPTVPLLATSTGTTGQIAWDADYFYVCVATNTWVRTALATWAV